MRPRVRPKPEAPSDEAILAYDNVPVNVAAQYIGWPEASLRLALREQRAPFGIAVQGEGRYTFHISPGGLVRYKRGELGAASFNELEGLLAKTVEDLTAAKMAGLGKVLDAVMGA